MTVAPELVWPYFDLPCGHRWHRRRRHLDDAAVTETFRGRPGPAPVFVETMEPVGESCGACEGAVYGYPALPTYTLQPGEWAALPGGGILRKYLCGHVWSFAAGCSNIQEGHHGMADCTECVVKSLLVKFRNGMAVDCEQTADSMAASRPELERLAKIYSFYLDPEPLRRLRAICRRFGVELATAESAPDAPPAG